MQNFETLIAQREFPVYEEELTAKPAVFKSGCILNDFIGAHDRTFGLSISEADAEISAKNLRKAFLYVEPKKAAMYIVRWGLVNGKREDSSMVARLFGSSPIKVEIAMSRVEKFVSAELEKLKNDEPKTLRKYHNTPETSYTEILNYYLAEREDKDSLSFRYLSMIARSSKKDLSK